jgi:hypothetical protein
MKPLLVLAVAGFLVGCQSTVSVPADPSVVPDRNGVYPQWYRDKVANLHGNGSGTASWTTGYQPEPTYGTETMPETGDTTQNVEPVDEPSEHHRGVIFGPNGTSLYNLGPHGGTVFGPDGQTTIINGN